MKIPKMNLSRSLHLNLLMLLTWYSISILHILLSLVHSLCPNHTIALVPCLCTLSNRDSFINFLVYFVYLFSLNLSFCILFSISFQTFGLLFSFQFLIFLLIYLDHKKQNKIWRKLKEQKETILVKIEESKLSLFYFSFSFLFSFRFFLFFYF